MRQNQDGTADEQPAESADVETITSESELLRQNPLVRLYGDSARVRILAVLMGAPHPLNVSTIVEKADTGRRTWYNHVDELLATGIVEEVDPEGTDLPVDKGSTLYTIPEPETDQRVEWMQKTADWTGAYLRDGERPTDA